MNSIRFLTPARHGALDYLAALALILLPWLLGFSGLSLWLSVIGGVGLVAYSLVTDYRLGVLPILPYRAHLALDLAAAAAFALAPLLAGWQGLVFAYYEVMAGGVLVVVALSQAEKLPRNQRCQPDTA